MLFSLLREPIWEALLETKIYLKGKSLVHQVRIGGDEDPCVSETHEQFGNVRPTTNIRTFRRGEVDRCKSQVCLRDMKHPVNEQRRFTTEYNTSMKEHPITLKIDRSRQDLRAPFWTQRCSLNPY